MAVFDGVIPAIVGAANAAGGDYEIERSLRFNSADSAYLSRTPSSASNRKTWTWSGWVKRAAAGAYDFLFMAQTSSVLKSSLSFWNGDYIRFKGDYNDGTARNFSVSTNALFRDPSAWYHVVCRLDTTQATAADRIKIWVNGVEQTFSSATYPTQNSDIEFNNTSGHLVGSQTGAASNGLDGYLAEVHFTDGSALAATDFGEYDDNNNWNPKAYSGSYGTNGFYLKFDDYSSDAALGTDSSGNGNDWTVNNITAPGTGIIYSNSLTTNTTISTGSLQSPFDGDTSTYVYGNDPGAGYFLFSGVSISYTTSLEVYYPSGVPSATFQLNGNAITIPTSGAWNTIATGSGTLTSLQVSRGGDSWFFSAIRVDGTILVDDNPANWDSLIDTPTNYAAGSGNNGGNYCTWSPIDSTGTNTLANGNLDCSGAQRGNRGTIAVTSGKYYYETVITSFGVGGDFGWSKSDKPCPTTDPGANSYGWSVHTSGLKRHNGSTSAYISGGFAVGDVIQFAIDVDAGKVWWGKNNTWGASGDPAAGTNAAFTNVTGPIAPAHGNGGSAIAFTTNFGQRPFAYTPPTGYVSLCTQNLTDPTIADGSTVFDVPIWTGDGTNRNITIDGGFSPDLVWVKNRSSNLGRPLMYDAIRGAGQNKAVVSDGNDAEGSVGDDSSSGYVASFLSDGFRVNSQRNTNIASDNYVAWCWDAGTTTESNTDGSITSSVRANASAGFSIVSYTGNQTNGATVGHGLNDTPLLLLAKNRDANESWLNLHKDSSDTWWAAQLNTTTQFYDLLTSTSFRAQAWDNTPPTSSVFQLADDNGNWNNTLNNNQNYIVYCFAPVEGYSAFGSYTGNGSSDGPFVYTGFRPKWVFARRIDATQNWVIIDAARNPFNIVNNGLYADLSNAEQTSNRADFTANGFKIKINSGELNTNAAPYIYAAFAEHPFKTARAR